MMRLSACIVIIIRAILLPAMSVWLACTSHICGIAGPEQVQQHAINASLLTKGLKVVDENEKKRRQRERITFLIFALVVSVLVLVLLISGFSAFHLSASPMRFR
jgi:uncharacterized membrane protein